jgi:hypothetical protein
MTRSVHMASESRTWCFCARMNRFSVLTQQNFFSETNGSTHSTLIQRWVYDWPYIMTPPKCYNTEKKKRQHEMDVDWILQARSFWHVNAKLFFFWQFTAAIARAADFVFWRKNSVRIYLIEWKLWNEYILLGKKGNDNSPVTLSSKYFPRIDQAFQSKGFQSLTWTQLIDFKFIYIKCRS